MLTDQHRLLIAAHVDGGLSPQRQEAVVRLLERSLEARDLLGKLEADARHIRDLPRQTLPKDFAERVLGRLSGDPGRVVVRVAAPRPDAVRVVLTRIVSAAAVVFVGVGMGLYWVFTAAPEGPRPSPEVAERRADPVTPSDAPMADPAAPVESGPPAPIEHRAENVVPPPSTNPTPDPPSIAVPSPPSKVLTAPAVPTVRLEEIVPARLSLPMPIRSLVGTDTFLRLRAELEKDQSHRVEIFCREPSRVADRLTAGCKDLGVKLVIDSGAQQAQKQRLRQAYLLFSDSFTADEWAVFFHNLGYTDRRAEEKKAGDGIFDQLVITPLVLASDQKEIVNHIGTDVLAPVNRPASPDKSEEGKSKPKPIVRQALLIPYQPQRVVPWGTKEIKQFLDARQERRPGQIALLVIIKPA